MIPLLYNSTTTSSTQSSIGPLADAISCIVTEERNGAYELEMVYPVDGLHYEDIYDRCIIGAIPSPYRDKQYFRVYEIEQPINGVVTIRARHVSYDYSGMPIEICSTTGTAGNAIQLCLNNAVASTYHDTYYSDITTSATFTVDKPASFRALLGGQEGSILDIYGGEYEFDNWHIALYQARGSVKDYTVEYGKNMVNFDRTYNIDTYITGIYPYWQKDDETVTLLRKVVDIYDDADFVNVIPVDLTDRFESKPSRNQLLAEAEKYISNNGLGTPKSSFELSFIDLASTPEYEDKARDLQIDLCDSITVVFPMYGIVAVEKIIKIETNVLLDRYESITVGNHMDNIADTIAGLETGTMYSGGGGGGGGSFAYPVGSVVTTSTNSDPSNYYAGTWTLIDKGFKSQTRSATISRNTTNFSVQYMRVTTLRLLARLLPL